ncbi:MAG: barstar family protein [Burkholderiaceae bacterium]|nr:barstar family protein [Burkholderiaceae bacterium]
MATVNLDGVRITDWNSFHAECKREFGFPDWYGNTMDAWIDCLCYLRDDEGMARFHLAEDEVLTIAIKNSALLKQNLPDLLEELAFCIGGVNERYEDYGEKPALKLTLL